MPPAPGYGSPYGGVPPGAGYGGGYGGQYGGGGGYGQPQGDRGFFGGGSPAPPPQTVYVESAQPQKKGMGTGAMLGIGAAGLVGGMLLEDVIDDKEQDSYQDGYEQGKCCNVSFP